MDQKDRFLVHKNRFFGQNKSILGPQESILGPQESTGSLRAAPFGHPVRRGSLRGSLSWFSSCIYVAHFLAVQHTGLRRLLYPADLVCCARNVSIPLGWPARCTEQHARRHSLCFAGVCSRLHRGIDFGMASGAADSVVRLSATCSRQGYPRVLFATGAAPEATDAVGSFIARP